MDDNSELAIKEKVLGNEAYKKKDFATAHQHYDKAIGLEPKNIVYLNNKAAAFFEQQSYDECIRQCDKAVTLGREERADYKLVAKAFARMANAYLKLGKFKEALKFYEKSLSEHRDPEVLKKYKLAQSDLKQKEKLEYLNPQKSDEEKAKGNELFKNGDFPGAMKHYTEAIKRNPENAVLYSNRAACCIKLAEFEKAVNDCDECLKKDAKNVKAYVRKGAALQALRKFSRAEAAYQEALKIDASNSEAREGLRYCYKNNDENPEKIGEQAMEDPEVAKILSDPIMMMVLQQMKDEPSSIQEHLQNQEIKDKLKKLVAAGVVKLGRQ